jgi:hypothetical protein
MACKQIDFRYERLKLNIRKRLYDFGKMPEAQIRNYFRDHYDPEQVTAALDELCNQGFCERFVTPRGASIIALRNEEQVSEALREDAEARVQEAKEQHQ